jgi:hypothetical protein
MNSVLGVAWLVALCGWLVIWAATGGLTLLRHYLLRGLLAKSQTFPWQARHFLDDATARVLLRRVGGGYGFVHRRLLDYFATFPPTPLSEVRETCSLTVPLSESVPARICRACNYQETRPQARFCSRCGNLFPS